MRTLDEIRASWDRFDTKLTDMKSLQAAFDAQVQLLNDIPDLLAEIKLLRHRLRKWEEWRPDDNTLADLKEQASGDGWCRVSAGVYIGALEWHLRHGLLAEKDAEIKRLTDVVEFRRVASNVQNQDIIELRATVAHLREWC